MKKLAVILFIALIFANSSYLFSGGEVELPQEEQGFWSEVWDFVSTWTGLGKDDKTDVGAIDTKEPEKVEVEKEEPKKIEIDKKDECKKVEVEKEKIIKKDVKREEKRRFVLKAAREKRHKKHEVRKKEQEKKRLELKVARKSEVERIRQDRQTRRKERKRKRLELKEARYSEWGRRTKEREALREARKKRRLERKASRKEKWNKIREKRKAKKIKREEKRIRSVRKRQAILEQRRKEREEKRKERQERRLAKEKEKALAKEKEQMEYTASVKDLSAEMDEDRSDKKEVFRVDLQVTSTVPLSTSMRDNKLIVEQVPKGVGRKYGKRVFESKLVASDFSEYGEKVRRQIYKLPVWPLHTSFFQYPNRLNFEVRYQHARSAFSSSGGTQDMSKLIFGQQPIYIKDILLESKLVKDNKVYDFSSLTSINSAQNYLGALANHLLCFHAKFDDVKASLGYVRHFFDDALSLGIEVPFVLRRNHLTMTTTVNNRAAESTAFEKLYGDSVEEFVKDVLCRKGIRFNGNDTQEGLGDISAFINCDIKSKEWERMVLGINLLFATSKGRSTTKLWDPKLGNEGGVDLSAFWSIMWSSCSYFNPHLFLQGTYSFYDNVNRRVPKCIKHKSTSEDQALLNDIGLIMPEKVRGKANTSFDYLDTTVRRFATCYKRVKIRRGVQLLAQVGNIFEKLIFRKGFGDIYYDLRLKGRNHISEKNCNEVYDYSILKHNTHEVEHRLGFTYSYQFDARVRAMAGLIYSFAGRNTPKTLEGNATLSVEF